MSGDPDPALAGTNKSIAIGLGLFAIGVCLAILPFAVVALSGRGSADLYTFAPIPYWLGMTAALVGLSAVLARVIKIEAIGAGNMKLMGFELPIEVGGPIFVTFFLLLGGAAVSFGTGVHNFKDNRASIADLTEQEAIDFLENRQEYILASEALEKARDELAEMTGQRDALRAILQAGMDRSESIALMRTGINCGDLGMHWIDWPERSSPLDTQITGILRPEPNAYVDPSDIEPFRIYRNGTTTYHLHVAGKESSEHRILSFTLGLGDDNLLTGTFASTGLSLEHFCNTFSDGVRGVVSEPTLPVADRLPSTNSDTIASETTIAAEAAADN